MIDEISEEQLEADLVANFPTLLSNVYCGIYLPKGWYGIVNQLCSELTPFANQINVAQIKEKFGELRFYVDFTEGSSRETDDTITSIIDKYESLSRSTCQFCGCNEAKTGNHKGQSWIFTMCKDCSL